MPKKKSFSEAELAALAKEFRQKAGKKKIEAACELGVGRANISLAEDYPEQSLTALRIRMIEKYSPYRVVGPIYLLERR